MSCDCILRIEDKLRDEGHTDTKMDVSFTFPGPGVYPHMGFTYIKEGRKSRAKKTLMPVFCPFCGNRY